MWFSRQAWQGSVARWSGAAESLGERRQWEKMKEACRLLGSRQIHQDSRRVSTSIQPPLNLNLNLVSVAFFPLPRDIHQLGFAPQALFVGFYMMLRDWFTPLMIKSITAHLQHSRRQPFFPFRNKSVNTSTSGHVQQVSNYMPGKSFWHSVYCVCVRVCVCNAQCFIHYQLSQGVWITN